MVTTQIVRIGPDQDKEQRATQAVLSGDYMYLSAQYAKDLITGKIISKNATDQIRAIFFNISKVLSAQSLSLGNVVKVTAYLRHEEDVSLIENALKTYFETRRPACTIVFIDRLLHKDARLCIDAVAYVERD